MIKYELISVSLKVVKKHYSLFVSMDGVYAGIVGNDFNAFFKGR